MVDQRIAQAALSGFQDVEDQKISIHYFMFLALQLSPEGSISRIILRWSKDEEQPILPQVSLELHDSKPLAKDRSSQYYRRQTY